MKRVFALVLALMMLFGIMLMSACKDTTDSDTTATTTTQSSDNDSITTTTSVDGASDASSTSGKTSSTTTSTTKKTGLNIVYQVPDDPNVVFPNKWTATKNKSDIPSNLKQNVKSGEILYLTNTKLTDDEYAEISATFKKLTGKDLKLNYKIVDWSSLTSTLQTMVMAQNAPDVYRAYNGVAVFLRNKGLMRNTNDYINMNDAVWKDWQDESRYMFYDNKLTGVATDTKIAYGFSYDKRLLGGLEDPWSLYKKGQWTIDKWMEYAEKLTKKTGNTTSQQGVACTTTCVLRMGLAMGEDIVVINEDGSYKNNLKSSTWTRYAGYARRLEDMGTMGGSSTTIGAGYGSGGCVLQESYWYANSTYDSLIKLKKANQVGWVPLPKDSKADKYYHQAETSFWMMPENSNNPWGAAAYIYAVRYQQDNRNATYANKEKQRYIDAGYTAEEYEYFTNGIFKDVTPIWCNWQNMPNFNYTDLMDCNKESWSTIVARANPKLESALSLLNK